MKKSRLTYILVKGDPKLLEKLALQIEQNYQITLVREPEKSLVMNKARDSVSGNPFYLGEILLTECTVSVKDVYGFGAVMGEAADRAYHLAIVDSAINARLPETLDWDPILIEEEERIEVQNRMVHSQIMQSKVNFDTMGEYHAKPQGS